MRYYPICFLLFLLQSALHAQQINSLRSKWIMTADLVVLDTLPIAPNSLTLIDESGALYRGKYEIDFGLATIRFSEPLPQIRLWATYRCINLPLSRTYSDTLWRPTQVEDTLLPEQKPGYYQVEVRNPNPVDRLLGDGSSLQRSGSLTRGIAFGNARDAAFQSAFNLQLEGSIGEGIEISAAITDENIPIQPDGNTVQLQDFDQIYVTLRRNETFLTAGDYLLTKPRGYFLNINKRAQGLLIGTAIPNNLIGRGLPNGKMETQISGAVARGKFRRQEFNGIEGNQGPYRLSGNEGETFILILSGSEAVFVDGEKLVRGIGEDYIIDYNTAEVTFMPKRMITKDSRIVIEFEYSDRNYQRWMLQAGHRWEMGRIHTRFNFFSEFDDRNTPIFQTLSDNDKSILAGAGDNNELMLAPGFSEVGFEGEELRYKKIDSLVNGEIIPVFAFSQDPAMAVWRVRFSFVGPGLGDYELDASAANGRVYRFVAPLPDGTKQGSYEPIQRLVPPQAQQMITAGAGGRVGKYFSFDAEGALSRFDRNTFSALNNEDNNDYGYKLTGTYERPLKRMGTDSLVFEAAFNYEQVGSNFTPFIRFRSVEFERDWNLINRNNPNEFVEAELSGTDYISGLSVGMRNSRLWHLKLGGDNYTKGLDFSGWRPWIEYSINGKRAQLRQQSSYTYTGSPSLETEFFRNRIRGEWRLKSFKTGIQGEDEINVQRLPQTDSLRRSAYAFHDYKVFVGSLDTSGIFWDVHYRIRLDRVSEGQRLAQGATAHHTGLSAGWQNKKGQRLSATVSYRDLQVDNQQILAIQPEQTLLTRTEYKGSFLKESIRLDAFYETGSGLENQRVYQFIPALNGLGDYVWIDYNSNGTKERDEFELRSGSIVGTDGFTYIKVFVPGNEYAKTYFNRLTANLNLGTPRSWKKSELSWQRFLHRFTAQTAWKSDRRTQSRQGAWSPLPDALGDTGLVGLNYSFRQSLYLNRFGGKFSVELSHLDQRNRILIAGGFEGRATLSRLLRVRWNLTKEFTFQSEIRQGTRQSRAELLRNREFEIDFWEVWPRLIWQPSTKFRITGGYRYGNKENLSFLSGTILQPGGEVAFLHRPGIEIKWNQPGKGSLEGRIDYTRADFNGDESSALGFEMLESLGIGNNFTWGLVWIRSLGKNLQLNLTYDGRKTESGPIIHLGGAQLRAFF
jgi:hypothetical protein